jgi:acyl-CoA synthetase (AMP-forming)/AMP-acid ligase II
MSPFAFLKDPLVWLRTITKYRGEITAAPNFAFTRCVLAWERMPAERRPHLDLSSLLFACNAAEPIRPSTLADFQATFGPVGFSTTAMCPAYGLAEHVVYAGTMAARPHQPTVIDPDTGFVACAVVGSNSDIDLQLMSFGGDEEGAPPSPVPPGATGEVWLSSPSNAAGYWARPDVTKDTFQNMYQGRQYLRTGDLAYIKDGLLYITGRLKDVIIVGGRNLYPQDVEVTVEAVSKEIRPGCVAAFQLQTGLGNGDAGAAAATAPDQIGIVAEVRSAKLDAATLNSLFAGIRQAVTAEHGLSVARIAIVKARTIPKTTSGKIRRSTCKDLLLSGGKLEIIPGGAFDAADAKQAAGGFGCRLPRGDRVVPAPCLDSLGPCQLAHLRYVALHSCHRHKCAPAAGHAAIDTPVPTRAASLACLQRLPEWAPSGSRRRPRRRRLRARLLRATCCHPMPAPPTGCVPSWQTSSAAPPASR